MMSASRDCCGRVPIPTAKTRLRFPRYISRPFTGTTPQSLCLQHRVRSSIRATVSRSSCCSSSRPLYTCVRALSFSDACQPVPHGQASALHKAARRGHVDVVHTLVEFGADVNHVDIWESSALHWAAVESRVKPGSPLFLSSMTYR